MFLSLFFVTFLGAFLQLFQTVWNQLTILHFFTLLLIFFFGGGEGPYYHCLKTLKVKLPKISIQKWKPSFTSVSYIRFLQTLYSWHYQVKITTCTAYTMVCYTYTIRIEVAPKDMKIILEGQAVCSPQRTWRRLDRSSALFIYKAKNCKLLTVLTHA